MVNLRAACLVALVAWAGASSVASAQSTDFVLSRMELAQPALAACDARAAGEPRPSVVQLELGFTRTDLVTRTTSADVGPRYRACIEEAVTSILSSRAVLRSARGPLAIRLTITLGTPAVAAPSTPYVLSQRVSVLWGSSWYPATVMRVDAPDRFLIHYDGWSTMSDEVVGLDHIRPADGTTPTSPTVLPATPARFFVELIPDVVVTVPSAPSDELVVDGGFEQTRLADRTFAMLPTTAWRTVSGPGAELQAGVAGSSASGRQHIELDSTAPSSIAQDLRTRPGQRYELRLSYSARPGVARGSNRLAIVWGGRVIARVDADGTGESDTRWITITQLVTADARVTTLELRDEGAADSLGTYIDDVSVIAAR